MSRSRAILLLAVVLAAAGTLVAARLGAQSLWIDEAITLVPVTAADGPADLVARVRRLDSQPPASHLLLYALRDLLPQDEVGWRLPSLLAAEIGILLLALTSGRLLGPFGLLAAGVCAQASPYLLFYAMEARNYALWFLAVAASTYALTRCLEAIAAHRPAREVAPWAAAWAIANGLGLWTHLFHLFALVVQAVVLAGLAWRLRPPREVARRAAAWSAAAFAGSAVIVLPWLVTVLRAFGVARGVGWTRPFSAAGLAYFPFALVFGFSLGPDLRELHVHGPRQLLTGHPMALGLGSVSLLFLGAGLWSLLRGERSVPAGQFQETIDAAAPVLFLVAPAAGLLGPLLFAEVRGFPLVPRHLMFLWPLVPLLQAYIAARSPRFRPALAAIVALQITACGSLLFDPVYAKDDERGAIRYAEARSGSRPVVLGDAAPLYTARGLGLMKAFTDPKSDAVLGSGATDLWLVDNRRWEDPEGNLRTKAAQAAALLGLEPAGDHEQFRGLVLRHWRRAEVAR